MPIKQTTSERTQVRERAVPNTAQHVNLNVGGGYKALAGFLSTTSADMQEKELLKQENDDNDTLAALSVSMQGRDAEVREALRSGDYSAFAVQQHMSRRAFSNSAQKLGGSFAASQDKEVYQTALGALPPGSDGIAATGEFIRKQTQGMPPMAAAQYQKAVNGYAEKMVNERQKSIADQAGVMHLGRTKTLLIEGVTQGDFANMSNVNNLVHRYAVSMAGSTPYAESYAKAREMADREIVKMAVSGGDPGTVQKAMDLMLEVDPATDLSAIGRLDDKYQEVVNKAIGASTKAWDARANDVIANANERLMAFKIGAPAEGDSLELILRDLRGYNKYGPTTNAKYQSMLTAVSSAVDKGSDQDYAYGKSKATGELAHSSNKNRDDAIKGAIAANDRPHALVLMSKYGAPKEHQQAFANKIRELNLSAVVEITSLMNKSTNRTLSEFVGTDPVSHAYYQALRGVKGQGEAQQIIEKIASNIAANGGKFAGITARKLEGNANYKGVRAWLKSKWNRLSDDELAAMGVPEGMAWVNLSENVKADLIKQADVASISVSHLEEGDTLDLTWKHLQQLSKGDYDIVSTNVNGELVDVLEIRKSPSTGMDINGNAVDTGRYTPAASERRQQYFTEQWMGITESIGFGGTVSDEMTEKDGTLAVQLSLGGGTPVSVSLPPGTQRVMAGLAEGPLEGLFESKSIDDDTGDHMVLIPSPGDVYEQTDEDGNVSQVTQGNRMDIDASTFMVWDERNNRWGMRYRDAPQLHRLEVWERMIAGGGDVVNHISSVLGVGNTRQEILDGLEAMSPDQRAYLMKGVDAIPRFMSDQELKRQEGRAKLDRSATMVTDETGRATSLTSPRLEALREEMRLRKAGEAKQVTMADLGGKSPPGNLPKADQEKIRMTKANKEAREATVQRMLESAVEKGQFSARSIHKVKNATAPNSGDGFADDPTTPPNAVDEFSKKAVTEWMAERPNEPEPVTNSMEPVLQPTPAEDTSTVDAFNMAEQTSLEDGGFLEDLTTPAGERFMYRFADFIEKREGFVNKAYDDRHGGKALWSTSPKEGDPTVGFGFNLVREDADEMLAAAGAPTKEQLLNGAVLPRPAANRLLQATTAKLAVWMKKHFAGVPMEQHRWVALMSLAYNSRWSGWYVGDKQVKEGTPGAKWESRGPTLIGPNITKAIKAGDWREAADEIQFRSEGGVAANQLNGIRARRRHEATMFIGQEEGR